MASTTPKARALGAELRKVRERTNISVRKLAAQLEISHSELSRNETGERPPRLERVVAILTALGVTGAEAEKIVGMSQDTDGPHWLGVGIPEREIQLAALLDFERTANRITDVSPLVIPGLLQTADYARSIMTTANVPKNEIDTRVATRLGRRDAIERDKPAEVITYIGEYALRQSIGGLAVMRNQLRHLRKVADLPHVVIRVIPERTGWHPGLDGPFLLLDFPAASPIVMLENRRSALFLHEDDDVQAYRLAVETIHTIAMSPESSSGLIADLITMENA